MVKNAFYISIITFFVLGLTYASSFSYLCFIPITILVVVNLSRKCRYKMGINEVLIVLFTCLFQLASMSELGFGITWMFHLAVSVVAPLSMYMLAKIIAFNEIDSCNCKTLVISLALGTFIESVANHLFVAVVDYEAFAVNKFRTIWSSVELPRTHHAVFLLLAASLLFYGVYLIYEKKYWGYIFVLMSVVSYAIEVFTTGRILLATTPFAILIAYFIFRQDDVFYNNVVLKYGKRFFCIILVVVIVGSAGVFITGKGTEILDLYKASYIHYSGGGIISNVRFKFMADCISKIPHYPWGFPEYVFYDGHTYSHNTCLDVFKMKGWIPGIAITILMFSFLIDFFRYLVTKNSNIEEKLLVCGAFVYTFLYNMIEVGYYANAQYWMIMLPMCGIMNAKIRDDRI